MREENTDAKPRSFPLRQSSITEFQELISVVYLTPNLPALQVGELTKAWTYFLPRYNPSLLEGPMFMSYSNSGKHGLKYCEKYVRDPSYNHRKEVQ